MIREKIRKNTIKIKCKNRETMSTQEKFIIGSKEKEDLVILIFLLSRVPCYKPFKLSAETINMCEFCVLIL